MKDYMNKHFFENAVENKMLETLKTILYEKYDFEKLQHDLFTDLILFGETEININNYLKQKPL